MSLVHLPDIANDERRPLFGVEGSRAVERAAAANLPANTLMQRAGLAVARLALALSPHAREVWIAAGPGNNGGDGLEAAMHLQAAGKRVRVSLVGPAASRPADASAALQRAQNAGIAISDALPPAEGVGVGCIAIDALLGLGASREPAGAVAEAIRVFNRHPGPRLAVDLPSGLNAALGTRLGADAARATHALSLLTLKPGLFTALGRDHCGEIWFDDLGVAPLGTDRPAPDAWLSGRQDLDAQATREHAQHKGSFGDVLVVGGATGMLGAALLAARAAAAAGAGRVYIVPLAAGAAHLDSHRPELMWRDLKHLAESSRLGASTTVVGCGGGDAVRGVLPALLSRSARLVLDADALNALAGDPLLQTLLRARAERALPTVLTPHPLEAARLLGSTAAQVQADRVGAASQLAARFACVVLLKGSGSVIAAPGTSPLINRSGNPRLASAGSGDVLAGWLGGLWSADPGDALTRAACAVAWHGHAADRLPGHLPLLASQLIDAISAAMNERAAARRPD